MGKYSAGNIRGELWPTAAWRGEFVGFNWLLLLLPLYSPSPSLFSPVSEKMSAVRRGDRRAERDQQSSPYKRPNAQPQKSVRPHAYDLPTLPVVGSHPRQSWSLSGFFNYLNPLRRQKPSEEPEEGISDESAGFDERQTTDGSDFGATRPPEILTQRGHAVRHTHLHIVCLTPTCPFILLRLQSNGSRNLFHLLHLRDNLRTLCPPQVSSQRLLEQHLLSRDPTLPGWMCHHSPQRRNLRLSSNIYVTALTNHCITLNMSV